MNIVSSEAESVPTPPQDFISLYLPQIEQGLEKCVSLQKEIVERHYGMMRYHLGFTDAEFRSTRHRSGKRIRPLLCLLACDSAGGKASDALPAAIALELLHNFSLVHDDIQDNSPSRRHRPTVWKLWGEAQAINVGDALFTLAHLALLNLTQHDLPPTTIIEISRLFGETCLSLTEGQFLDMQFEQRADVTAQEYLQMIAGKTTALLAASCQIGAMVANAYCEPYYQFGHALGLAFQLEDDLLGIWGEESRTGKSASSDILQKKKSLPVILGLTASHPEGQQLRDLYEREVMRVEDVAEVQQLLESLGTREETARQARKAHDEALAILRRLEATGAQVSLLQAFAETLLERSA